MSPASRSILAAIVPVSILLAALLLRLPALHFGLPADYHPDEIGATRQTGLLLEGHAIHGAYKHPPLLRTLAWGGLAARRLITEEAAFTPAQVTLGLRWVSLAAGILAVAATYAMARAFLPRSLAWLPAALYAVFPLTVFSSVYGTPDMLLAALTACGLALALALRRRPRPALYALAGLATGLAVGAKYPGGLLVLPILVAHALAVRRPLHGAPLPVVRSAAWFACAMLAGLLASFPFVIGEWRQVLADLRFEFDHLLAEGHRGIRVSGRDAFFTHHLRYTLLPAGGPLVVVAGLAGFARMIRRRSGDDLVLLAFAAPYALLVEWVYLVPPAPERYALPLVAPFLVAAGVAVQWIPRPRRPLAAAGVIVLLAAALGATPAWRTVTLVRGVAPDTREVMGAWIRDHVPSHHRMFAERPTCYCPDLSDRLRPYYVFDPESPPQVLSSGSLVLASSFSYARYLEHAGQAPAAARFYEDLFRDGELLFEADAPGMRYLFHNPTLRLYRVR